MQLIILSQQEQRGQVNKNVSRSPTGNSVFFKSNNLVFENIHIKYITFPDICHRKRLGSNSVSFIYGHVNVFPTNQQLDI